MKLLEQLLLETRRKYKRLPNISTYKELEPYKNKDDYYISFTSIEKIGVNPRSKFGTPLGIYAYPLKEAWKEYNVDIVKDFGNSVPFAGERPHVWLLKLRDGVKFIKSAEDYTSEDLSRDTKILMKYVLDNKEKFYRSFNVERPEDLTESRVIDKFNFWARTAKIKSEVSKLWNITRNVAAKGRDAHNWDKVTSIITNWNTLFYKVLGYYGFADKTGTGYIHSNEPVQAVFFTKSAFNVVSLTPNKEPADNKQVWIYRALNSKRIKTKGSKIYYDKEDNIVYWESGDWIDGTWEKGTWEEGTWHKGTWINGTWENGIWKGGTWENGIWKGGSWVNGIWENGKWESGKWHNGTWKGGIWKDGWIYDTHKEGNFKPEWESKLGYVRSPISPAEYWKDKRRSQ